MSPLTIIAQTPSSVVLTGAQQGDLVAFVSDYNDCIGAYSSRLTVGSGGVVNTPSMAVGVYYLCYSTSAAAQDTDFLNVYNNEYGEHLYPLYVASQMSTFIVFLN